MAKNDEPYEFTALTVNETDAGILLLPDDCHEPVWFPKSLTTVVDDTTFTVPQWLAEQKGIV